MKLKITTSEIEFEFDFPKATAANHIDGTANEHIIRFIKESIQKAAEETIKIKNR